MESGNLFGHAVHLVDTFVIMLSKIVLVTRTFTSWLLIYCQDSYLPFNNIYLYPEAVVVPGTVLSAFLVLTHLILTTLSDIPISHVRKLSHRAAEELD